VFVSLLLAGFQVSMNLSEVIIETDRLILKPIDFSYTRVIFAEFTTEITKYMTPVPARDDSGTVSFITSAMESLQANTSLQLVILDKRDNSFLGCAGLHGVKSRKPELGIWIKKAAHGNKYGREAVTSLILWAGNHLEYDYLAYPVDKRNIPSRKIPESNGGMIDHEFKFMKLNGFELDEVEYRIYRK
jgi:ribosomal-protein-alanine N-acetyltransferase